MRPLLAFVFTCLLTVAFDQFTVTHAHGIVVDLTEDTFSQFLKEHQLVVVDFYAPWCHHCQNLFPHFEEAARLLKKEDSSIVFAKVDATVEQSLGQAYVAEGYPTLKIFHRDSPIPVAYEGPRESGSAIANYVKQFADPTWKPPQSNVVTLTSANFTKFTTNEELTLVDFYAPWCSHCKTLEPIFEKAALALKNTNIRFAKVDGTLEQDMIISHNITGYPALFVYRKGGKRTVYEGDRTEQEIVANMKQFLKFPSQLIRNDKEYKQLFRKNDRPVIIGIFTSEKNRFYELFTEYAYRKRHVYQFGHTFDNLLALSDVTGPAIIIQHHPDIRSKFEPGKHIFTKKKANESDLDAFVEKNKMPLVGVLTPENQRTIYLGRRPICIVMYDVDFSPAHRERTQYWRAKMLKTASNFKNRCTFVIADEHKMSSVLKDFGLEDTGADVNVGCYDFVGYKYRMDDKDEFTAESFEKFVDRLDKGRIKPYIKSQPIPKKSIVNGIQIVVGKNFDQIVKDGKKNVLIMFYTPSCGTCTEFKATYTKLAESYSNKRDMVFAQMDAIDNDVPPGFEVTGYPTIYIVPTSNIPVKYEGNREMKDLVKFIEKNIRIKTEL